jgi:hypothetical protein
VAEPGESTMHVISLPKREHLIDSDAREPLRVGFEGVEDCQRLGVEHTDDNVGSLVDVLQHSIGLAMFLGQRRMDRRRVRLA